MHQQVCRPDGNQWGKTVLAMKIDLYMGRSIIGMGIYHIKGACVRLTPATSVRQVQGPLSHYTTALAECSRNSEWGGIRHTS